MVGSCYAQLKTRTQPTLATVIMVATGVRRVLGKQSLQALGTLCSQGLERRQHKEDVVSRIETVPECRYAVGTDGSNASAKWSKASIDIYCNKQGHGQGERERACQRAVSTTKRVGLQSVSYTFGARLQC
jgi:hypothetical protein